MVPLFLPFVTGAASAVGGAVAESVLTKLGIGEGAKLEEIASSLDTMSGKITDLKESGERREQQLKKITSDLTKISKNIGDIQQVVTKIDGDIEKLSNQILDILKQLTINELEKAKRSINSRCDEIFTVMELLGKAIHNDDVKGIKLGRQELHSQLRKAKTEFPTSLDSLDSYLTHTDANGVLVLMASKALEDGADFVTYWMRMRIFITPYWLAQARAISVLAMILKVPQVPYFQGIVDIAKFGSRLKGQLELFEFIVGNQVCNIMNQLTAVKENGQLARDYLTVELYSNGMRSMLVDQTLNVQSSRVLMMGRSETLRWQLHPLFDCRPDNLSLEGSHTFQIKILNGDLQGVITACRNGDGKRTPAVLYNPEQNGSQKPYDECTSDFLLLWKNEPKGSFQIQAPALKDRPLLFTAGEQWGAQSSYALINAQTVWCYDGPPDPTAPAEPASDHMKPDPSGFGTAWWIPVIDKI